MRSKAYIGKYMINAAYLHVFLWNYNIIICIRSFRIKRPCHHNFFKVYLPQILLCLFLNTFVSFHTYLILPLFRTLLSIFRLVIGFIRLFHFVKLVKILLFFLKLHVLQPNKVRNFCYELSRKWIYCWQVPNRFVFSYLQTVWEIK